MKDATPEQHTKAQAVSKALGGLPLALRRAGAYIASDAEVAGYQALLTTNRPKRLRWKDKELDKDARTVYKTFTIAFDKLAKENVVAAELLRLCAFLAPDAILKHFFSG